MHPRVSVDRAWKEAIFNVYEWVSKKRNNNVWAIVPDFETFGRGGRWADGRNFVEVSTFGDPQPQGHFTHVWALRYDHFDSEREANGRIWRTDLALNFSKDGTIRAHISTFYWISPDFFGIEPVSPKRTVPAVVSLLLNPKNGLWTPMTGDVEIADSPFRLVERQGHLVQQMIDSHTRQLPIIYPHHSLVSINNPSAINTRELARRLMGSAIVIEPINSTNLALEMNSLLGSRRPRDSEISLFNPTGEVSTAKGDIRPGYIIRPNNYGTSPSDFSDVLVQNILRYHANSTSRLQPGEVTSVDGIKELRARKALLDRQDEILKFQDQITRLKEEIEKAREDSLAIASAVEDTHTVERASENITDNSQSASHQSATYEQALEGKLHVLEQQAVKRNNELSKLRELLIATETQNKVINEQYVKLEEEWVAQGTEIENLSKENEERVAEINKLKAKLHGVRVESDGNVSEVFYDALRSLPGNPSEVVQWARDSFKDTLIITEEAESNLEQFIKKYKFKDHTVLAKHFFALATDLHKMYFGEPSVPTGQLENQFKTITGFELAITEGRDTKANQKYMKLRQFPYDGKIVEALSHTKLGSKQNYLRVYYYVDREKNKIVVVYAGEHLDSAATSKL